MEKIHAVYNSIFNYLDEIKISPLSRAYTFSDSVYEVIPFFNSNSIAFESHINRLERSCKALNLSLDMDKTSKEIIDLIAKSNLINGYVYYQVSRGIDSIRSHMFDDSLSTETFGYVVSHSFKSQKLKVMTCEDLRWQRCDIKSTSLLGNVLSMNEAKEKGCDEVIMHNDNILTEAGASNLFFVKDGDICTPALSNNILPGITRQILIDTLSAIDINVYEKDFTLDDLTVASSAWLTSSTKGMAPIEEIINLDCDLILNDDKYLIVKQAFDSKFFN